ncbi:MAG: 2,4'-dihydroxyacetophenone dioxygenase family protein [Minwuia sp.]|nr:2,4'-dihydroxyacetophenone dioxygenase family protein [Minwuia sp.]
MNAANMMAIPLPSDAAAEIVEDANLDDEMVWMQTAENVWLRPLFFNVLQGMWVNAVRARGDGIVSRHRHPSPVTGYTLDGSWGYVEHDWIARPGTFIYEPAGETHTLYCKGDAGHMTTIFHNFGPLLYVDEHGNQTDYEDVFTRLEKCKDHYRSTPLGEEFVTRLIR